jgi:hypothetical protein
MVLGEFANNTPLRNVSKELLFEIYSNTKVKDEYRHDRLIAYMGKTYWYQGA